MTIAKISGGIHTITNGKTALESARANKETSDFQNLLNSLMNNEPQKSTSSETLSGSQIISSGRINGDYTSSFAQSFTSSVDKSALPQGAAANSNNLAQKQTIDKTSVLYEKSLELESYLVKMMLSSMKNTINKSGLFGQGNEFAHNMYTDMLYDEYAVSMTKNAGFGLADQIYLQLHQSV